MRTKSIVVICAVIIVVCAIVVGAYYTLQPQYKTITMSGITLEVPNSNAVVNNTSTNYNTYDDKDNNLSIKTWAYRDMNELNETAQAGWDIGTQYGSNLGQNVTYDNVSVSNKSGTYSYYEADIQNECIILITGTDIDQVTHVAKSINKTGINPVGGNLTLENITNNTTIINNTDNSQSTSTAATNTRKNAKTSSDIGSSSSSDDSEYEDVPIPGSNGKTVKAKDTGFTDYGHRYETADGKAIYV
ncbi:hypothetical protein [uncultured Methanosphaera sp.]|uniref:hypothetical protein n=1 Tax=uncultured Methanosphaera sp. TaxID=262501 RepID=UPI000DC265E0|nr:hypothetical protein [uncultured Methanosphaera sp.]RAP44703.1 MAG: hypothetical protein BZ134_02670 [Methanosphaera sp. SHI1033]